MRRLVIAIALLTPVALQAATTARSSVSLRERAARPGGARVVVLLRAATGARHAARGALGRVRRQVLDATAETDVRLLHAFAVAPGFVAQVTEEGLRQLVAQPDVVAIEADARGHAALATSVPQIAADRVQARGLRGDGVTIAILDSGVDAQHPDLADALDGEECFCASGCCPDGSKRQSGPGSARSLIDHGVHVSGIALSRGRIAPPGVAPGARLLAIRVIGDDYTGALSDWISALDWIAATRADVRVVNMSVVSDVLFAGDCDDATALNVLFADVIDTLYARGTLLFAAAGNNARADQMSSPACIHNAVSVSSVTADDEIAFSGNSSIALDLLAPGVGIVSDAPGGNVVTLSGTSMAAPHAAGAAALLLGARPGAGSAEVLQALQDTGMPILDVRNGLVTPRVSVLRALTVLSEQPELVRGGGSGNTDCLLEWRVTPMDIAYERFPPTAECRDDDPACDADTVAGQCTFHLSLCFNLPDPNLPRCDTSEALLWVDGDTTPAPVCVGDCNLDGGVSVGEMVHAVGIALGTQTLQGCPAADAGGDGTVQSADLLQAVRNANAGCGATTDANAHLLADFLPTFPVNTPGVCSVDLPMVVTRATASATGIGMIRLGVGTATRTDYDRFEFICRPPE